MYIAIAAIVLAIAYKALDKRIKSGKGDISSRRNFCYRLLITSSIGYLINALVSFIFLNAIAPKLNPFSDGAWFIHDLYYFVVLGGLGALIASIVVKFQDPEKSPEGIVIWTFTAFIVLLAVHNVAMIN